MQKKKKDSIEKPAFDFMDKGVFQICGGTRSERNDFFEKIQGAFERRRIKVGGNQEDYPDRCTLAYLVKRNDLVIITGECEVSLQKIILNPGLEGQKYSPEAISCRPGDRDMNRVVEQLEKKLSIYASTVPVWACILIGGKSSRMGQPKHLIRRHGNLSLEKTWIEKSVELLEPLVSGVVISGAGEVPRSLDAIPRLEDIPGVPGPMSGVLAAMRWQPYVSWLLLACDMPAVSEEAVRWLLEKRSLGCWGKVPRISGKKYCEPLLAWYDFRASTIIEEQLLEGNLRINAIAQHSKIENPTVPEALVRCFQNINTPEQLGEIDEL